MTRDECFRHCSYNLYSDWFICLLTPTLTATTKNSLELIAFGGLANEENIRSAFQNCLAAYCAEHSERLVLVPELRSDRSNKPDGTIRDSLRMTRGLWEAKDTYDDLDREIRNKLSQGYSSDNILFEDSRTAVLVQDHQEAMRTDMTDPVCPSRADSKVPGL